MKTAFRVGDHVTFPLGARRVTGTITEDRGPIGVRGQRIFQVEVPRDPLEPTTFELQEDEIEPGNANEIKEIPGNEIIDYLVNGGLIAILRCNTSGGKNQPRAWLCRDSLGNLTHTFVKERGQVGGQMVPFFALHDDRVFEPKENEVLNFIQSFGLRIDQAKGVLKAVGQRPD